VELSAKIGWIFPAVKDYTSDTVQNRHPVTLHTSIVISVRMDLSDCKGLHEINTSPETVQNRHPVLHKTDKSKTYTFTFGGKALTYEILV
jgi:hypothetical protein